MASGDSHTGFDAGAFTAGAAAGSLAIAGALVAGLRNAIVANERAWDGWNADQLVKALRATEELRLHAVIRAETAERELRQLKSLLRSRGSRGGA
jgi:hypothetical protein